jgi:glutathione S-transferase
MVSRLQPTEIAMRLYHFPFSFHSRRAMMAALHMGTPLDVTEVDLMNDGDRRRLLEINPNSKVPVLQDAGFTLWESCAVMQYLAERTLGQTLYPDDVCIRADINRWLFWSSQHLSPALAVLIRENVWKGRLGLGYPDPRELDRGDAEISRFAAVLDRHLAGRTWVVGETITLADYALAAPMMYLDSARLPLAGFAHLMAWFERVRQQDAWKHTEPVW